MKRQTITFTDASLDIIEKYRKAKSPIPTFNEAVLKLIEASKK